jgi:pre-mRNA-splicing helicase BRR2
MEMEDEDRIKLLTKPDPKNPDFRPLTEEQLEQLATACNRYPNLVFEAECETSTVKDDEEVTIKVTLERDGHEEDTLDDVYSQFYPKSKNENWWIVVGESSENKLHTIKRVNFVQTLETVLKFDAPSVGKHQVIVYLICDSYVGCDQESSMISFDVQPSEE